MPIYQYQFNFISGPQVSGQFTSSSDAKARGEINGLITRRHFGKPGKADPGVIEGSISRPYRITNTKTRAVWINSSKSAGRGGFWQSETAYEKTFERRKALRAARDKRPFQINRRTGHKLPGKPLDFLPLELPNGDQPPGSSGFAYMTQDTAEHVLVSDTGHIARFWPAKYDAEKNRWVAIGAGEQMEGAK